MKPNISLACKNGSRTIVAPPSLANPSSNPNANPNPNFNRGRIFLGGNCPDTGKNKRETKNRKEIKKIIEKRKKN